MKKIILFIAIFIHCLTAYSYDFEVDGIRYTIISFEESTVAVAGFDDSLTGIIELPSTITYNNRFFTVTKIYSGKNNNNIETVIIPTSIIEITGGAFSGSNINRIEIPDNVKTLGEAVFKGCTNLSSVKISKNISKLNYDLFNGCTSLTYVDWHPTNSYNYIYGQVFYNCSSLKSIRIPSNVTLNGGRPGNYASLYQHTSIFKNCSSLDSLIMEDGHGYFTVPYHNYGDDYYGEFQGCSISYVYLGRSFKETSNYTPQYPYLGGVRHLEIGDSVTTLHTWLPNHPTYWMSKGLKTLVIGSSLTEVASFANDTTLEYIKIKRTTPPEAAGFSNYNYINTVLYVPKGCKPVYQSADKWKNFWNIEEFSDNETETNKCAKPLISYSEGRLSFSCETDGVTFHSSITDSDIKSYNENEIQLNVTYNINVYASKPGYDNSDVATATLCWVDVEPQSEGLSNDVTQVLATPVLIQTENGCITIKGADERTKIYLYGINGQLIGEATSQNGYANIRTNLQSGSIVIIKIGSKSVKTIIK